jgi:hypothetical protein
VFLTNKLRALSPLDYFPVLGAQYAFAVSLSVPLSAHIEVRGTSSKNSKLLSSPKSFGWDKRSI